MKRECEFSGIKENMGCRFGKQLRCLESERNSFAVWLVTQRDTEEEDTENHGEKR